MRVGKLDCLGAVIRIPTLPVQRLQDALGPPLGNTSGYGYAEAVARTERRLLRLFGDPVVKEAIALSSWEMSERLSSLLPPFVTREDRKLVVALYKYVARMATRPSPFGLFAGCTAVTPGQKTLMRVKDPRDWRRAVRIDNGLLIALAKRLEHNTEVRGQLRYYPNSTLTLMPNGYHYSESSGGQGGHAYRQNVIRREAWLRVLMESSRRGLTLEELVGCLTAAGYASSDARRTIDHLIDAQALESDLKVPLSGVDPLTFITSTLTDLAPHLEVTSKVSALANEVARVTNSTLRAQVSYDGIAAKLRELNLEVTDVIPCHVNLCPSGEHLVLGESAIREIASAAHILAEVGRPYGAEPLRSFKAAFLSRFEEGQWVPLKIAVDEDFGVGLPDFGFPTSESAPLLSGLPSADSIPQVATDSFNPLLYKLLLESISAGEREMILTPELARAIGSTGSKSLPPGFAVIASIVAELQAANCSEGPLVFAKGVVGPTGLNMIGRFCHDDAGIAALVASQVTFEASTDQTVAFVEVIHRPGGRVGNVLHRPLLREYELVVAGCSGSPRAQQLTIEDLSVSVQANQVLLWSKSIARRIVPRLSNAHNFDSDLQIPLYRFLCALQAEHFPLGFQWSWGNLSQMPYLPRVRVGNVILSRGQWSVSRAEIEPIRSLNGAERFSKARSLFETRGIPRWVGLQQGENLLPVDLMNPIGVDAFLSEALKQRSSTLAEMWEMDGAGCAISPSGSHLHELVVPFVNSDAYALMARRRAIATTPSGASRTPKPVRAYPPGESWLYARVEVSYGMADRVLSGDLWPALRGLARRWDAKWFFIRYGDPRWHLRVRVRLPPKFRVEAMTAIEGSLGRALRAGRIHRFSWDTYNREVERYGGEESLRVCESIFSIDSEAVLRLLGSKETSGPDVMVAAAVAGVLGLWDALGMSLESQTKLASFMRDQMTNELGRDSAKMRAWFSANARRYRHATAASALKGLEDQLPPNARLCLRRRRSAIASLTPALTTALRRHSRDTEPEELAGSLAHMFLNRLFDRAHRPQETAVYDLVTRALLGFKARA
jgi:lantibiotic biosynthesis protein